MVCIVGNMNSTRCRDGVKVLCIMELDNRQCLRLSPIVCKSLKQPVHC